MTNNAVKPVVSLKTPRRIIKMGVMLALGSCAAVASGEGIAEPLPGRDSEYTARLARITADRPAWASAGAATNAHDLACIETPGAKDIDKADKYQTTLRDSLQDLFGRLQQLYKEYPHPLVARINSYFQKKSLEVRAR